MGLYKKLMLFDVILDEAAKLLDAAMTELILHENDPGEKSIEKLQTCKQLMIKS